MATETIELEVDPETARRYRDAGADERARIRWLFSVWMKRPPDRQDAVARLKEAMDRIGQNAESRGLTPDILADLLADV